MQRTHQIHPEIREVSLETVNEIIKSSKKLDSSYLFLHIPKTGGSSFMDYISSNQELLAKVPTPLFHTWTLKLALQYLPSSKIICFLRDPLERTISGYQSRSRMGLPKYRVPWRPAEASAFALFPTIIDFLSALSKSDERSLAAVTFAMQSIMAVRWNYEYYFESAKNVKKASNSLIVYRLEDARIAINNLIEKNIICPGSSSLDLKEIAYPRSHASSVKSSSYLERFSHLEINEMKSKLDKEYEIYNELLNICCIP